MWQSFSIDVIKKEAVGQSLDGIDFNMDSSEAKIFLRATQGEVGVKFTAVLLCNGEPYYVCEGAEFSIWYEGASGSGNYTQTGGRSPVTVDGNVIQIEVIPQMLCVPGGGTLGVMIHEADNSIRKLFHLTYIVDEFPGYGSEEAKEYFTAFSQAVADVKDSVVKVKEAAEVFETDESLSVAGKAADAAATSRACAPHNYLDNSDFRNPVNQRGQTSYTSAAYCIDRWFFSNNAPTFEIDEGVGVTVTANSSPVYFNQRFLSGVLAQRLAGKNVTFGAMTDKGLLLKTMVFPSAKGEFDRSPVTDGVQMTIGWSSSGDAAWVDIVVSAGTSLTLYWAAFYEGEYTVETLPDYKPKGYGVELAECMRYFRTLVKKQADQSIFAHPGSTGATYYAEFSFSPMRIAPSLVVRGESGEMRLMLQSSSYALTQKTVSPEMMTSTTVSMTIKMPIGSAASSIILATADTAGLDTELFASADL